MNRTDTSGLKIMPLPHAFILDGDVSYGTSRPHEFILLSSALESASCNCRERTPSSDSERLDESGNCISSRSLFFSGLLQVRTYSFIPVPNMSNNHRSKHVSTLASLPERIPAGTKLWAFYRMQGYKKQHCSIAIPAAYHGLSFPPIGWSDRWFEAVLVQDFEKFRYLYSDKSTWPRVEYQHRCWYDRDAEKVTFWPITEVVHIGDLLLTGPPSAPTASLFVLRPADGEDTNEWDENSWGHTGSSVSDAYIYNVFTNGVHSRIGPDYEVLTAFVRNSHEMDKISEQYVRSVFSGRHLGSMMFGWVCAFEDNPVPNCAAGFLNADKFFALQRRLEAIGIHSRFPHPSHFHRTIIAKDLYANLCLQTKLRLPKCVKVNRASVVTNPGRAAERAIANLECLMNGRPLSLGGVTKLGYSWEAMDVRTFNGAPNLAQQLGELFFQGGCYVDSVLVQERVPNSFEFRFFVINGEVRHTIYTHFGAVSKEGLFRDFEKTDRRVEAAQKWFKGDVDAVEKAESIARECVKHWQQWFLTEIEEQPPAIRFDFIIGKSANGQLTVHLGELCELGFSIMNIKNAEHDIFPAIADAIGNDRPCVVAECALCKDKEIGAMTE